MQTVTTEQALENAVASAEMEGLHPTEQDIQIIKEFIDGKISREEFVNSILVEIKGA